MMMTKPVRFSCLVVEDNSRLGLITESSLEASGRASSSAWKIESSGLMVFP